MAGSCDRSSCRKVVHVDLRDTPAEAAIALKGREPELRQILAETPFGFRADVNGRGRLLGTCSDG